MSRVLEIQPGMLTVQRSVAPVPADTPVAVVLGSAGFVMTAAPLTTLQAPVPAASAVALSVKEPLLQLDRLPDTTAADGPALLVNTTSEVLLVQLPLLTVQRNIAILPAGTPVTVVLASAVLAITAVPLIKLHVPAPMPGTVAASVKLPLLHCTWFAPATAVDGVW